MRVSLWDAYSVSGKTRPSSRLFNFTSPTSLVQGDNVFTAPAGKTLAANSTYFVHFERTSGTTDADLNRTTSDDEDSGKVSRLGDVG